MKKVIGQLIIVIIAIVSAVFGIYLGGKGLFWVLDELKIINENIYTGIVAILFGWLFFVLGDRLIDWILKSD